MAHTWSFIKDKMHLHTNDMAMGLCFSIKKNYILVKYLLLYDTEHLYSSLELTDIFFCFF